MLLLLRTCWLLSHTLSDESVGREDIGHWVGSTLAQTRPQASEIRPTAVRAGTAIIVLHLHAEPRATISARRYRYT